MAGNSVLDDKEKYVLKPDEYMATARAFTNLSAVLGIYKRRVDSIGIHLTDQTSGSVYLVSGGNSLMGRRMLNVDTLPNFKKIDPKTLEEDTEAVLWLMQGLGMALYEKCGRRIGLNLKTKKPSDFYSLPSEFYK